ncbi:MAG: sigma-70 family RNA polymerase sigma factor [Oligoflexia bacterium]|nr:sigma-70 family RNA polymerase sigma factor [Oligoflexia bacterium]
MRGTSQRTEKIRQTISDADESFPNLDESFPNLIDSALPALDLEGLYRREISSPKFHELSQQEEVSLLDRIQLGRSPGRGGGIQFSADALDARDKLIGHKLQLVARLAHRYMKFCGAALSRLDLLQAGNIGLIQAAERYEGGRGATFDTFAVTRIRGAILDFLREARTTVRPSRKVGRVLNRMEAVTHKFFAENGRNPTLEEISDLIHRRDLHKLEQKLGRPPTEEEQAKKIVPLSPNEIRHAMSNNVRVNSIDTPAEDEDGTGYSFLENLLAVDQENPVDSLAETLSLRTELNSALRELPFKHEQVIRLWTGFAEDGTDPDPMTLKAIGILMGFSESRTSQMISEAIARLRQKKDILRMMKSY